MSSPTTPGGPLKVLTKPILTDFCWGHRRPRREHEGGDPDKSFPHWSGLLGNQ